MSSSSCDPIVHQLLFQQFLRLQASERYPGILVRVPPMIGQRNRLGLLPPAAATSRLVRELGNSEGMATPLRRQLHLPAAVDRPLGPEEEESARRRTYLWGCVLVVASGLFFVTSLYAIVFSKLMPPMGHPLLDAIREDFHYCYLVPLTIYPSCAALYMSWVSLKFFRHN